MKTRLLTSAYILIVVIIAFISRIFTPYVFDCIIGALAVIGAVEVSKVLERAKFYNTFYLAAAFPAVLYVGFTIGMLNKWYWEYYLLLILGLMAFFFLLSFVLTFILKKETEKERSRYFITSSPLVYGVKKAANTVAVLIYPSLLFACLFLLNHINSVLLWKPDKFADSIFDFYILITIFLVTMLTDTFAMLTGKLLKGPKLCPRISPNKTISGALGGLLGGIGAAFATYYLFTINLTFKEVFDGMGNELTVLMLGLFGAVLTQVGDIFASFLKRVGRVKDYGTIFPGHGGVMDRYDGLVFNAAFVLIFVLIMV